MDEWVVGSFGAEGLFSLPKKAVPGRGPRAETVSQITALKSVCGSRVTLSPSSSNWKKNWPLL